MPLPMVHFGVSHNLISVLKPRDVSLFYLGSVAPDAVHMRENYTREDKNISHLYDADMEVWRKNAIDFIIRSSKANDNGFYLSYGVHILTDIYWSETVLSMFKERYNEDKAPVQEGQWAYYNDTDRLDFELHKKCEYSHEIWSYLLNCKNAGIDGLVSPHEVNLWKEQVLHWFDKGESKHKNKIKYVSLDDLTTFMMETTARIRDVLFNS